LRRILTGNDRPVLIVDCEGAELQLMNPVEIPDLRRCDVIIECHDFVNPAITKTLQQRFATSHDIENIIEASRDPNKFLPLQRMQSIDRWIAINEGRPATMNWLICWAR
jgi:hypothetical protein